MAKPIFHQQPAFFGQALLILLPLAVLAAVSAFSLRQDRILAEHEAAERAQSIADDLLPKLWSELTATNHLGEAGTYAFTVDALGHLLSPPPLAPVPVPIPLNPAALTPEPRQLWQTAQLTETEAREAASKRAKVEALAAAADAYHKVIASNPPEIFAAAAYYSLGLLLAEQGNNSTAAEMFDAVLEKYPDAVGESGVPLQPLAQLKLLELAALTTNQITAKHLVSPDSLCSNAVWQPALLTPYFLSAILEQVKTPRAKADAQKWQHLWEDHERSRHLFAACDLRFAGRREAIPPVPEGEGQGEREQTAGPYAATDSPSPLLKGRGPGRGVPSFAAVQGRHAGTKLGNVSPGNLAPPLFWFTTLGSWRTTNLQTVVPSLAVEIENPNWLALRIENTSTSQWFLCRAESKVASRLTELADAGRHIPDYFGLGFEVAQKKLAYQAPGLRLWREVSFSGKTGGVRKEYYTDLATNILASTAKTTHGMELLKVNVYLTSPAALFKRQSARTFWFGSLIAVSAAAALIGLFTAWRAFLRQQQLSEMKSDFVSSVSHELRAPIASVRLMAESLERGKVRDAIKQSEYFRFIGQECRRLSALIENVLDFARIEQRRKQYQFEPTDIVALIRQTASLMETYAAEKEVVLNLALNNLQPATCNLELSVDGRALQQALVNLIDNAVKHSPRGGTITVGLECSQSRARVPPAPSNKMDATARGRPDSLERTGETAVLLWVEDHGDGIPPDEHDKIFERFYRRGSELRRETQGVGIGLSIVKHIVEAHGGRVLVRSAVGQGSRFTIELPASPARANSEDRIPKAE